ncbi:NMDA receptor-regulated protein 1 [Microthyrium microscopicum]|uniref:NMDA receptor-regulated protein 1 n=1 Tax=Microthyrium microscopicum TaxID=703497 RepID=A0A6A6U5K8_9PEZI|nr:NMDA receptor-regulated protein 1 [Microthyrium microscopicum]
MPQTLSSKDQANFRSLVRLYEAKQYKKAIKTADQILKKNANHGETEAMKALTINSQGNQEEAFALGKVALQHDMKSHITWHVYGILWRSVKNYDEAIRAYKMALRIEPESAQILRDLALLQVQMRDYQGHIQSRKLMLQAKPTLRQNWTGLAVAHHIAGELKAAESMLETYEGTLKQQPSRADSEHSEAALYRNMIIEEEGDNERALEHLNSIKKTNLDRTAVLEVEARLLLKLGRLEEAEKAYRGLVDRNNEYRAYFEGLEKSMGLDRAKESDIPKLVELYESYASKSERLDAARRIPLDFLEGERFEKAADAYLQRMLRKGVPSTFTNIKGLYADESKRKIIIKLVEGYLSIAPEKSESESNGDKPDRLRESTLFYLNQHYNYHITRDLDKALKYVEEVIKLAPKNIVYIQAKARVLKHLGNVTKAAEIMEFARASDEKDRYINTKAAKYQLRNNDNDRAVKTMSKFTRNEAVGGALGDLHDMQCMWFLTEDGEAYVRRGKLGLALKRFKSIYDIFETWYEDQFDFHFFSIRKGAVRAYMDLLRWEDHIRDHPFFSRAAINAINIYCQLYDDPSLAGPQVNGSIDFDKLDANEKKKALKKAKKEQEKQEKVEAERRESERKAMLKSQKAQKKDPDAEVKQADADPNGKKLLETKTPLDDATPYVNFLLEFAPKNIESQFAGFDVFVRKAKILLALKCIQAAHQINPDHPGLHERLTRFRKTLDASESSNPKVAQVIKSCISIIPASSGLSEANESYLTKHKSSPQHIYSALRTRAFLDPSSKAQNEKELLTSLDHASLEDAIDGLALLKRWGSKEDVKSKYVDAAMKKWSEATVLSGGANASAGAER